ncbi:uncharacterized protein LOC126894830 [Daktulosphaira vitifoliae]|uniref:uncharacterized protein LOC126894830 n=1 Tax=Daktulosphaira vitifoliae TaxID=58002 RepID=UPI0021AA53C8|nr:uncharacterized protein LOC126894830 [Daktulosphaira vitifoliae]
MIFYQYCVLTIIFGIFCNIQFITCSYFREATGIVDELKEAEEVRVAFNLDTGFSYNTNPEMFETELNDLVDMIYDEDEPAFVYHTKPHVIYNDLYCGDLYNFLQYINSIQSLIEYDTTYEYNHLLLNESIIQQMLAEKLKVDVLTHYLQPFWKMYMFAIYIKNQTKDNILSKKIHVTRILENMKKSLSFYTTKYCRKNNKYNLTAEFYALEKKEKISIIEKVKTVMVSRSNINNILLHGEEVEDWVSLKIIYLHDIIQNTDMLKTIIMDFGEQSEKTYEDIIKDINIACQAAKNYYWFDIWIFKIRVYHDKIFNIFRVVTLHLIRKYLMYLRNKDGKIMVQYNKEMRNFLRHNWYTFNLLIPDFSNFPDMLLNKPGKHFEDYDHVNNSNIGTVEYMIEKSFVVESFKILQIEVTNEIYNMNSIEKTNTLMKLVQISNEKKEKIEDFQNISDNIGLNDNFERFNIFLEYFKNIFKHKLRVLWSFKQFSSDYNKTKSRKRQEEKFLDL